MAYNYICHHKSIIATIGDTENNVANDVSSIYFDDTFFFIPASKMLWYHLCVHIFSIFRINVQSIFPCS